MGDNLSQVKTTKYWPMLKSQVESEQPPEQYYSVVVEDKSQKMTSRHQEKIKQEKEIIDELKADPVSSI